MNLYPVINRAGYRVHPKDFQDPNVPPDCFAVRIPTKSTGLVLADLLESAYSHGLSPIDALDLLRCTSMMTIPSDQGMETIIFWRSQEWP